MKKPILIFTLLICSIMSFAQLIPVNLKCEYLKNPMGIDMKNPRLFWQLQSEAKGDKQTAYQLLVASSKENLEQNIGDVFNSKKVKSDQNTHVIYKGAELKPASDYFWKVKVWDKDKKARKWSETVRFTTGLFTDADWKGAEWIAWKTQEEWETAWWKRKEIEEQCHEFHLPSYFGARMSIWERYLFHYENPYAPSPLYRKEFIAGKEIKSAKAFIAGIGYNELYINGNKVGDNVLEPGWTNYSKTVLYVTHDVTKYFSKGGKRYWYNAGTWQLRPSRKRPLGILDKRRICRTTKTKMPFQNCLYRWHRRRYNKRPQLESNSRSHCVRRSSYGRNIRCYQRGGRMERNRIKYLIMG